MGKTNCNPGTLLISVLSIIFAIFLDVVRHSLFQDCVHNLSYLSTNTSCTFNQTFNGVTYESYDISILWQLPQEYMAAVSEVFVVVTAYQIAYLQAPDYEEEPCKIQNVGSFPFVPPPQYSKHSPITVNVSLRIKSL